MIGTRHSGRDHLLYLYHQPRDSQVPHLVGRDRLKCSCCLLTSVCGSPYVQPIVDPNPRVMPTRHLFKDRDGNWREIIGDEAAEAVLGHKLVLDGSDGARRYTERWIEGVDGVQYELLERESVTVGHRAWVQRFGDRPNFHASSYGNTAGSYGGTSTSTTGPLALNRKTNTKLPKSTRESHASPLRQEVARDGAQGEDAVGRAF